MVIAGDRAGARHVQDALLGEQLGNRIEPAPRIHLGLAAVQLGDQLSVVLPAAFSKKGTAAPYFSL